MNQQPPIRIIFAEDHDMLRESFAGWIEKSGEVKVVATAANGEELVEKTREHRPDVVITDIRMPVMDGLKATEIIKKEFPQIKLLGISSYDDMYAVKDMMDAGASGFVIKNIRKEEMLTGIKALYSGKEFFCTQITRILLRLHTEPLPPGVSFTEREIEVLKLVCDGCSNKEIASELKIKVRTVETHRSNLYKKTGARGLVELAVYASKHGVIGVTAPKEEVEL